MGDNSLQPCWKPQRPPLPLGTVKLLKAQPALPPAGSLELLLLFPSWWGFLRPCQGGPGKPPHTCCSCVRPAQHPLQAVSACPGTLVETQLPGPWRPPPQGPGSAFLCPYAAGAPWLWHQIGIPALGTHARTLGGKSEASRALEAKPGGWGDRTCQRRLGTRELAARNARATWVCGGEAGIGSAQGLTLEPPRQVWPRGPVTLTPGDPVLASCSAFWAGCFR